MIEKKPFVRYDLEEDDKNKAKVTSLKLNEEEQALIKQCQEILQQPKEGTCIKALVHIGAKVVLEDKMMYILGTIFKNRKNNKRNNIFDFD